MANETKKKLTPLNTRPPVRRLKFSIWYLVIAVLGLLVIQSFLGKEKMTSVPYSSFKQWLAEDKITRASVQREKITGEARVDTIASGQAFSFQTIRVEDPDLVKEMQEKGILFEGKADSDWLKSVLLAWVLPLGILFLIWSLLLKRMGSQGGMMSIGKSKAKIYMESATKITFNDVAGLDEAIEELSEVVEFLKTPERFKSLGGTIPKGVLLIGPPGTGKTLLARAVAGEAKVPFFSLSGSDFVEMFVGVGAARVRDLFQQASAKAPAIIFIDELDALGKSRGMNPFGGHDEREQTLNQLLVEMDGFDPNVGVILMAATNRPETLDLALLRPGRFDRQIVADRPDIVGREAILNVHMRGKKVSPDVNLKIIAARTPGFVGADLANVMNEAALLAARRRKKHVEMAELEEAIDRVIAGLERKSRVLNPKEKERVAYHETGHAIVGDSVPDMDAIHRISIIPRGVQALGYTLALPTEDRYLMTKTELTSRIKFALGGRVAEELIFGEVSTGAQNDLERATAIARSMVTEYGMSERLGPLTYGSRGMPMMGRDFLFPGSDEYGERTANEIDMEVKAIVEGAYEEVRAILADKKELLIRMAKLLLEKEVLEGDELKHLLNGSDPEADADTAQTA
ncbi:ATP-dependent zinc metalloprotease FtsH [bacterium]|nr:ATP-dependent zinc metalloprotease FtsH [bacterium]